MPRTELDKKYTQAKNSGTLTDLIIMDLTVLGGMGGRGAVKKILAINPNAKVLVSNGYSNDSIMGNYKKCGVSGATAKPYQLNELMKVLGQIFSTV